jgi:hypothetical protein
MSDENKAAVKSETIAIAVLSPHPEPKAFSWALENFGWGEGHWVNERPEVKMQWHGVAHARKNMYAKAFAGDAWRAAANGTSQEYEPVNVDDYLKLVPWQHRQKNFLAVLKSIISGAVDTQNFAYNMNRRFDVDSATGIQLDQIGEWVGLSRTDVEAYNYTGVYPLPDGIYRNLIKAKIAANHWDGTIPNAYEIWESAFNHQSTLVIEDHQDMSMSMYIIGIDGSGIFKEVIKQGLISFKPGGVRIRYLFSDPYGSKFFAWGEETPIFGGWGKGHWADIVT